MAKSKNEFYLRRIHSLLGIIPIGAFLIVHLMVNHQATQGAEAFNKASAFMESLPFLIVVELVLIYIPILYHGLYGIHIAFTAKENIGHYSLFRNWMFALQRLTGIITFVFVFVHLWQTHLQKVFFGKEVNYDLMHATLQSPLWVVIYIICIIAVVFHFSNGLWSFLVTWGILQSKKSQRVFTWVSLAVFLVLSYIGVTAILAFT
ncbi:succinate dehydrogenase [Staphylococcus devriesei]|uniref:Succinate dehydrogenase n=1 Tax=Staphylococcus devriesei TaxID=586733 RepID=A0A2K4DLL6_9STAP|nr:succinate dehydrogenase cytochrome b558 subunit [Staphylococcus devriesei]MCE5089436.1 succinate dehydrogenase cytochrome b558 subunit [Staphylococcus devriesei]MCE5096314.1 succinate dehydrogenase cytochrome b558 subunit [Staphylococcus devriesei]PNZ87384.1 succinate dehydrogenase [Staphylococcus devriesei]PTE74580.1 succinate dehydrogenase [Staphylococcus devriesei]PTF03936.1 succinate dehydrogenase [Staphylococcus devriesei]